MDVGRNFYWGWQRRHFAYPFHVTEDAMQMDGHKTLHPCHTQCLGVLRDRNGLSNFYLKPTVEPMYNHHQHTPKPRFITISRYSDEIVAAFQNILGHQGQTL